MSRRDNRQRRCDVCDMHNSLCICALEPRFTTRTQLILILHQAEKLKTTNTGRLALRCISPSRMIVRGTKEDHRLVIHWDPQTQPVFLFPHADAKPLSDFANYPKPISLIVPDGTWRQASKVRTRYQELKDVPVAVLPHVGDTQYRLRSANRPGGLATAEAIARAMGILEGAHVQEAIEKVFRVMVDRTLYSRGRLTAAEVFGGVPDGVVQHDPLSGSLT